MSSQQKKEAEKKIHKEFSSLLVVGAAIGKRLTAFPSAVVPLT
jgi:hypothetical protein